jgi:NAD(P)H-dependent flavin oxidoreductase YrpB (nitropropane dioxygenase family)
MFYTEHLRSLATDVRLSHLVERYIEVKRQARFSKVYIQDIEQRLGRFNEFFGTRQLKSISSGEIEAAGGIADGRGLAAALMLGAAGVLMGTRFYASHEAAGAQGAKECILEATGDDTLRSIVFDISRRNVWPAPFTGRCLRNAHADRWFGREIELMRHLEEESAKYAAARDAGDFDIAAVIAGEAVGIIHDIPSAHEVIERVVREASALLTRWSS